MGEGGQNRTGGVAAGIVQKIGLSRALGDDGDGRTIIVVIVKWFEPFYDPCENGPRPLAHFQEQTRAPHAFQAVVNLPYEQVDCFRVQHPKVVPAKTLLGQLL